MQKSDKSNWNHFNLDRSLCVNILVISSINVFRPRPKTILIWLQYKFADGPFIILQKKGNLNEKKRSHSPFNGDCLHAIHIHIYGSMELCKKKDEKSVTKQRIPFFGLRLTNSII